MLNQTPLDFGMKVVFRLFDKDDIVFRCDSEVEHRKQIPQSKAAIVGLNPKCSGPTKT